MTKIRQLRDRSFVQILDETGQPIDHKATVEEATNQGLWHMGIHVLIWDTTNNLVAVQKRSPLIVFNPSCLDISVGGGVNRGESPERAALREVQEELGIMGTAKDLDLLFIAKYNRHLARYNKHVRVFCHTYLMTLAKPATLTLSPEVSEASFITWEQAWSLVNHENAASAGRLMPQKAYFRRLLTSAERLIAEKAKMAGPSSI